MKTRTQQARRHLAAAALSPETPWMLALLTVAMITGSITVLIAFWAALAVRAAADWTTRHHGRHHADRQHTGDRGPADAAHTGRIETR